MIISLRSAHLSGYETRVKDKVIKTQLSLNLIGLKGDMKIKKTDAMGLDTSKIYYGTIKYPSFMNFSDLTENDIKHAVQSGSLQTAPISELHTLVNIATPGDAVLILIPTTRFEALKQPNKKPFQESIQSYQGTGVNGSIKLGGFYVYGEILIVAGNLEVHVE